MEQRLSLITLGVADLARSREFHERLGWRRSMAKAEGVVFFQAGGMARALFPRTELAQDAKIAPEAYGFSGISLAYNTRTREAVDAVMAQAEAAGAKLLKPAEEAFWGGYPGYFSDPGRISMGGCMESVFPDHGGWQYSGSGRTSGVCR